MYVRRVRVRARTDDTRVWDVRVCITYAADGTRDGAGWYRTPFLGTHPDRILFARMHARTYARTHVCTHARMHACTHARTNERIVGRTDRRIGRTRARNARTRRTRERAADVDTNCAPLRPVFWKRFGFDGFSISRLPSWEKRASNLLRNSVYSPE